MMSELFMNEFQLKKYRAGLHYEAVSRFGESYSCCCLSLLPQLACSILQTWKWPYTRALKVFSVASKSFDCGGCATIYNG